MRELSFKDADAKLEDGSFVFNNSVIEENDIKIDSTFTILNEIKSKGDIKANYKLTVLGSINAKEITVQKDLICFGDIECEKLNVHGELKCYGNIKSKKVIVDELATINNAYICEGRFSNNLIINGSFEVDGDVKVEGNVICNEGIIGNGSITCKYIYANEYLEVNTISENEKEIVDEKKKEVENKTLAEAVVQSNGLDKFINSSEYMEFIKDSTVAFKKIEMEIKRLNNYDLKEIKLIFSKLALLQYKFKKDYKILDFIHEIQDEDEIKSLSAFLRFVNYKRSLSKYLMSIDICRYTFENFLEKQRKNLDKMSVDNIKTNETFASMLNLVEKNKTYFSEKEYTLILEKIYSRVGVSLKLVSRKLDVDYRG